MSAPKLYYPKLRVPVISGSGSGIPVLPEICKLIKKISNIIEFFSNIIDIKFSTTNMHVLVE
jgi:hypothetical protein